MGYDRTVDATGLNCPLPLLKAKKELATMTTGQQLYVIATDPGSLPDFTAFAEQSGHRLLLAEIRDGKFHLVLARK